MDTMDILSMDTTILAKDQLMPNLDVVVKVIRTKDMVAGEVTEDTTGVRTTNITKRTSNETTGNSLWDNNLNHWQTFLALNFLDIVCRFSKFQFMSIFSDFVC